MRELFPQFTQLDSNKLTDLWSRALFVFDSNVLLSLYRLPKKAREKLLEAVKKLNDRAWLPHQVALEFYRNRTEVINNQEKIYLETCRILDDAKTKAINDLNALPKHPYVNRVEILQKFSVGMKEIRKDLDTARTGHPDLFKNDDIEKELNEIFKGKVGK